MRWIDLESAAEAEQLTERRKRLSSSDAEQSGATLLDLVIDDHQSGLGGRYLLTLVKRNRTLQLPWHRFRVGSPIVMTIHDDDGSEPIQGVVSARTSDSVQVAVNEWPDGDRFRIDLSPDEITRRRQQAALRTAEAARGRLGVLRSVLLGDREPTFGKVPDSDLSNSLNSSQEEAIRFALSAEDVAIIHGPPGTGKTTTVAELIRQAIARGDRVLACAPSNTAVDNLLERLVAAKQKAVRLGHPARVSSELRAHTLDVMVENHENMSVVRDMMREAEALFRKAGRYTRSKPPPGARQDMRREARQLRDDARLLERQAVDHVIDRADVVCATTTIDESVLGDRQFDVAVVDEACQCTEPGCWIPLLRAQRIILAGDHCQLPPTVISTQAAREGFTRSLLERLVDLYDETITRQLNVQYRMHQDIMRFSSSTFYGGQLQAHESVAEHVLSQLPQVTSASLIDEPVTFIDTAGADYDEELEPDGESRRNPSEGELVLRKVQELYEAGLGYRDIAVIAPYAAQVRWLRERFENEDLEVDTVDGFQGREKEAVVISLVRSNKEGEIGFLADTRRMNVALTRARRKLIVIGDSSTIASHDFYCALLEYFDSINAYHSVWEEDTE